VFSRFFIERPVFAAVVAILITLAGAVALTTLPVQQYPGITPVQVTVQATYPGADSQTLADSVAAPIEAQINGVDNMLYMSSTSSSSQSTSRSTPIPTSRRCRCRTASTWRCRSCRPR
jgi:multidrug efflux pump